MKKLLAILILFGCAVAGRAQGDSLFQLVKTYSFPVADAALDNLGNLYLVTTGDQLKKFSSTGDSVGVYNNVKRYGKLHSLDVSNPLRPLLFYKDFSSVVVLDRFLSVRTNIDLRRHNILQPTAAGQSYDNNIWLFDAYDNKLKKINEQGTLLLETPDFRVLFDEAVVPQQITDNNGWVYLYDPAKGLYVFDYYGSFKRKIPVARWGSLFITDQQVWGIESNTLNTYSMKTLLEKRLSLPQHFLPYYRYSLSQNRLIALAKDSVSIYMFRY